MGKIFTGTSLQQNVNIMRQNFLHMNFQHTNYLEWSGISLIEVLLVLQWPDKRNNVAFVAPRITKGCLNIYIYIIVEKSPNSSHMYDHGFMDNTNRQAVKNWLDSQTRDASLTSWRQPFCKWKWFTKWLPPWRKGRISCLWIKSVFDCLTIGIIHETMVVHMTWVLTFFNNYSNLPRMCVLSTLCGNVNKHSPFDIYIHTIYMQHQNNRFCVISSDFYLE